VNDSAVHRKIVGLLSTLNIQLTCHRRGHSLAKSHQLQRSHCLIIETELDDMLGVALFKQLLSTNHGVPPTIFITVRPGSTAEAVEAMTLGAVDYIEHPFFARQLISSLELALAA
jgi:FixJ family two-component response regulator